MSDEPVGNEPEPEKPTEAPAQPEPAAEPEAPPEQVELPIAAEPDAAPPPPSSEGAGPGHEHADEDDDDPTDYYEQYVLQSEVIRELRVQLRHFVLGQERMLQVSLDEGDALTASLASLRIYRQAALLKTGANLRSLDASPCGVGCKLHTWDIEEGWGRVGE